MKLFRNLLVVLLAFSGVFAFSSPASAHDELESSSPADGSAVSAGLIPIELTFAEAIMESPDGTGTAISVIGPDGNEFADSCIDGIDGGVITDSVDLDKAGEYTVNWRTVSSDGHPVEGSFAFIVENNDDYVANPVVDCALAYASGLPEQRNVVDDQAQTVGIDPLTGLYIGIGVIVVISVAGALNIRAKERKAAAALEAKRKSQN
jgi:methionine-rich copper-binding protein CopC